MKTKQKKTREEEQEMKLTIEDGEQAVHTRLYLTNSVYMTQNYACRVILVTPGGSYPLEDQIITELISWLAQSLSACLILGAKGRRTP